MIPVIGLTPNTEQNIQLDAGVFYKNLDPETAKVINDEDRIGATKGGGTFSAIPKFFTPDIDGLRGDTRGLKFLTGWEDIKFSTTVSEVTLNNLKMALVACDIKKETNGQQYDIIEGSTELKDSDYIDCITWLGKMLTGNLIGIRLNTKDIELKFEDNNNGTFDIELTVYFDLINPEQVPFKIYYPTDVTKSKKIKDT